MRRILTVASSFVLVLGMTSAVKADLVSDFWAKVLSTDDPNNAGSKLVAIDDEIRVVFVSSASVVATPGVSHAFYDGIIQTAVSAGALTGGLGSNSSDWKALVSTQEDVSWNSSSGGFWQIDDTPVSDFINQGSTDLPVFNTNGDLVAIVATDMLAGLRTGIKYDASIDDQAPGGAVGVWTGTADDGSPSLAPMMEERSFVLGNSDDSRGTGPWATMGDGGSTANWLDANTTLTSTNVAFSGEDPVPRLIYGMSGEITVVPEPSTILMWLGFSGIAGLIYWRKRRS